MLAWPYRHHPRKERSRLVTQLPATTPAHILSPAVVVVTTAVQHEDSSRKVLLSWFFDFMRLFPPFSDLLFLLGHLIHPTRFTLLPLYIHRTHPSQKKMKKRIAKEKGGRRKRRRRKTTQENGEE
jgi:hypothetical protein